MTITSGIILESPWKQYSDFTVGFIAAALLIGAMIGAFCCGFISDRIGPKKTLGIGAIIIIICDVVLTIQKALGALFTFRAISGLSVGVITALAPLYVSEQSSSKFRGMLGSSFQLFVCTGILIAYGINYAFGYVPDGKNAWRWEFLTTILFAVIYLIGWCFIPESKGHVQKKEKQMVQEDYHPPTILEDVKAIIAAAVSDKRAFIVGMVVAAGAQLTGINAIMNFSPSIIESIGDFDQRQKLLGTVFIGIWNLLTTFISFFLVDKFGRKPLLLSGFSLMFVGNLLSSLAAFIPALEGRRYAMSIPGLAIFVLGFEIGPGPGFFVLVSELYRVEVRGRAMGIMVSINWICNILLVEFYLPLTNSIGVSWVFLILSILCILMVVFVALVVPETKGIDLDAISGGKDSDKKVEPAGGVVEAGQGETAVNATPQDFGSLHPSGSLDSLKSVGSTHTGRSRRDYAKITEEPVVHEGQ